MNQDPLATLRDIYAPTEPSWWPPAIGWWLLAATIMLITAAMALWLWRRYQRKAPIRVALTLLELKLQQAKQGDITYQAYVNASNEIIKRVVIGSLGKSELAAASGQAWLEALDQLSNSDTFTVGPGQVLGDLRFAPIDDGQLATAIEPLHREVEHLLRCLGAGLSAGRGAV